MRPRIKPWIGLEHDGNGWRVRDRSGFMFDIVDMPIEVVPDYLKRVSGEEAYVYDWYKGNDAGTIKPAR